MEIDFTESGYKDIIKTFLQSGYSFELFEGAYSTEKIVYLRHDVDFSIEYAYEMALIDQSMGIKSTFFLLPNSELYNLYSRKSYDLVNKMIDMGHDICLHIDVNLLNNLETAVECFRMYYPDSNVNVVSFHQLKWIPSDYCLPQKMVDVYSSKFFSKIEYASDSGCEWRYGYPLSRMAFESKSSFQLLIHPIWWMTSGGNCKNAVCKFVSKVHTNTMHALSQFRFMQKY